MPAFTREVGTRGDAGERQRRVADVLQSHGLGSAASVQTAVAKFSDGACERWLLHNPAVAGIGDENIPESVKRDTGRTVQPAAQPCVWQVVAVQPAGISSTWLLLKSATNKSPAASIATPPGPLSPLAIVVWQKAAGTACTNLDDSIVAVIGDIEIVQCIYSQSSG